MAQLRRGTTWLLFVASLVAVFVSYQQIDLFVEMLGVDYPRRLSPELPILTEWLLARFGYLSLLAWGVSLAALAGAGLAIRYVPAGDARLHVVSLITSLVYHLVVMLWAMFTIAFFILPAVKAG